jgi:hypothetical protein
VTGRLVYRVLAAALTPVVAGCDAAVAVLAAYEARRHRDRLVAGLEQLLAEAAGR